MPNFPRRSFLTLLALVLVVGAAFATATSAMARPRVRIIHPGRVVHGTVSVVARVNRRPRRVIWFIDGRRIRTGRGRRALHLKLNSRRLRNGRHAIAAAVSFERRASTRAHKVVAVLNPTPIHHVAPSPSAATAPASAASGDALWHSTFDSGRIADEWSFWGQGQESMYGHPEIVDAAADGLPNDNSKVVKLYHAAGDPTLHHKLYKNWTATTWPSGAGVPDDPTSPADVSGSYSARFFIPSSKLSLGSNGWINIFQFKESYLDGQGGFQSNPDWWLAMTTDGSVPHFELASWGMGHRPHLVDARPYLDRWFTVEARLYQGDRVEIYIDGQLIDTGRQSTFPVGRHYHIGQRDEEGNLITANKGWTFGVGNYVGNVSQQSLVYVDDCALRRLPAAG